MTFRPDIEGMRAVSVLFVVLYHYFPLALPGGYIGVDVFFVISGYLITQSLLEREGKEQHVGVALATFWSRRARRLLPNALLVLVFVATIGLATLSDYGLRRLGSDIFWAASYAVNWLFVLRSLDYLQWDDTKTSILLHYWSLAVEEQFYFVWPALLIATLRRSDEAAIGLRRASTLAVALAALSLLYCVVLSGTHLTLGFFSSPARAWELLVGAWLALGQKQGTALARPGSTWSGALVAFSLLALLGAAARFDGDTGHPGLATLMPVLGAAGVICWGGASTVAQRWLGHPALRAVGARSYSIYLWHWPVLMLGRQAIAGGPPWLGWTLLPLSLLLAEVAYRTIETPARFRWARGWSARRVVVTAAVASAFVAALGFGVRAIGTNSARELVGLRSGPAPTARFAKEVQRAGADLPVTYRMGCHLPLEPVDPPECAFGDPSAKSAAVLFGDSHAAQWFPALAVAAERSGHRLYAWTKSSCPSADVSIWNQVAKGPYRQCNAWRERVFKAIEERKPELVVISNMIDETAVLTGKDGRPVRGRAALAAFEAGLERTLKRLQRSGAVVVVISDTPRPRPDIMECLSSTPDERKCEISRPEATAGLGLDMRAAGRTGVAVWDFADQICPGGRCPVVAGVPPLLVYRDSNHLTASFVRSLAPQVEQRWRQMGR